RRLGPARPRRPLAARRRARAGEARDHVRRRTLPMRCVTFALVALVGCSGDDGTASDALNGGFTNPIIPMYDRPAGVPHDIPSGVTFQPTEGCPDPQGLKTKAGEFFIYCT